MPVKVERMPDAPVIMVIMEGVLAVEDLHKIEVDSVALGKTMKQPIARIADMRNLKIDFSQLVILLAEAARGEPRPGSTADPNFKTIALVAPGTLVALGAASLSQEQYGALNIAMVESMDEALRLAQQP
jgi:hypothetical protein